MLATSYRTAYNEDHEAFRDTVRKVFAEHLTPHMDEHEANGIVPRDVWKKMGDAGMLCMTVKEENGGLGLDFGFNCVLTEELSYIGSSAGFTLQNDITANYFERLGNDEQRAKYLPGMVSGEIFTAIAMTEPGAGSDLQGIRTTAKKDGNHLVINGSKTYITNGQNADCVIVVAKTDPERGAKGISLVLVDADTPGFERGRNLDKIGQHAADTSELFFNDCRVPMTNILGAEGMGFVHLMEELPQERFSIALSAACVFEACLQHTIDYVKSRQAFGQTVWDFQNTKFKLAECATLARIGRVFIDSMIKRLVDGENPPSAEEAAMAKVWCSEQQWKIVDECLQLFGGYGYMQEYPICHFLMDARIQRLYGGSNEVLKELIARKL